MKKTLIALSLVALSGAASADVILYGQIKAGVEVAQTKVKVDGVETKGHTETNIADFGSRIGFKGHEHLGSGLNAIWQVENSVSVAGGGTWAGRDSFIGLEGENWGKVRAGRLSTQLKNMADNIDPWEYDNKALGLGVFTRTGTREVSVRYDTPVWAGFSGNVQFTPRDNQSNTGRDNGISDSSSYYAGLNYENSGFFAQYGYGFRGGNHWAGESKNGQAHQLMGGYNANNLFVAVAGQYTSGWDTAASYAKAFTGEDVVSADYGVAPADGTTAGTSAPGIKTKEVAVTGAYTFGNVTPRLSYAHGWDAKEGDTKLTGSKYDQVVLGADYDFSKRTTAFVQAGWLRQGSSNDKAETTGGLVGLRHKF